MDECNFRAEIWAIQQLHKVKNTRMLETIQEDEANGQKKGKPYFLLKC